MKSVPTFPQASQPWEPGLSCTIFLVNLSQWLQPCDNRNQKSTGLEVTKNGTQRRVYCCLTHSCHDAYDIQYFWNRNLNFDGYICLCGGLARLSENGVNCNNFHKRRVNRPTDFLVDLSGRLSTLWHATFKMSTGLKITANGPLYWSHVEISRSRTNSSVGPFSQWLSVMVLQMQYQGRAMAFSCGWQVARDEEYNMINLLDMESKNTDAEK
jgi:hypothetical protein